MDLAIQRLNVESVIGTQPVAKNVFRSFMVLCTLKETSQSVSMEVGTLLKRFDIRYIENEELRVPNGVCN